MGGRYGVHLFFETMIQRCLNYAKVYFAQRKHCTFQVNVLLRVLTMIETWWKAIITSVSPGLFKCHATIMHWYAGKYIKDILPQRFRGSYYINFIHYGFSVKFLICPKQIGQKQIFQTHLTKIGRFVHKSSFFIKRLCAIDNKGRSCELFIRCQLLKHRTILFC